MRMSLKNFCCAASAALALAAGSANAQVVISQAYGGGGNAGALFTHDFIELFNRGAVAVDISGWSVQYGSAGGATFTASTVIPGLLGSGAVMLQPGQYYLIQEAAGAGTTMPALPTPDLIGTIAMGGTGARVALMNNAVAIVGPCPSADPALVDVVGWASGTVTCSEGTKAGATANSTAIVRGDSGCMDTNNNATDFAILAPTPRNTSSPLHVCSSSTPPSGIGSALPTSMCLGGNVVMSVAVTPGASPVSTGIAVTGDLTSIGGGTGVPFLDDGIAPDVAAGDMTFTAQASAASFFYGNQSVPITITDAESRIGNASVGFAVVNCDPSIAFTGSPAACESYAQLLVVAVTPGQSPASTGIVVTADMSTIGAGTVTLVDDGTGGDPVAGDGFYGAMYTIPGGSAALLTFPLSFSDAQARVATASANITNVGACSNAASSVVISQLYGAGGNTGATLTHDYVELFNRGATAVDLTGWSLQRLSANGTELTFSAVPANFHQILSGTIQPGQYFLVQEAAGAGGTQTLPTPDAVGAMTMSAGDAMMFLTNSGTLLASFADPAIMDRLGYGSNATFPLANFEGHGAANSLGVTVAAFRQSGGCQDTNNNDVDFYRATPAPRNSSTPLHSCSVVLTCPADLDNGSGSGTPDGGVDINDLLFFLVQFEAGSTSADLDNGSGNGIPDGGVDINDLLFFLTHFEAGC